MRGGGGAVYVSKEFGKMLLKSTTPQQSVVPNYFNNLLLIDVRTLSFFLGNMALLCLNMLRAEGGAFQKCQMSRTAPPLETYENPNMFHNTSIFSILFCSFSLWWIVYASLKRLSASSA